MVRLHHIGIFTAHPRRLLKFYTRALGFTSGPETLLPKEIVSRIFAIGRECVMAKLLKDAVALEIFWFKGYTLRPGIKGPVGYNHFGIELKGPDAFCDRLSREFGIKVTKIKRGDHYNYFIRDPDKNIIEIKEMK